MNYCVHIFLSGNKVLLLKRSKKIFFSFDLTPIIGKIKDQEGPDKAVIRETIEETSLKSKTIFLLCSEKYKNDNYWFYYSLHDDCLPNIELNHENEDFDFFEINDLPNNLWGFLRIRLEPYRIIIRIILEEKSNRKKKDTSTQHSDLG